MLILWASAFLCNHLISANKISYEGYSLLRITPTIESQLQYLLSLNANTSSGLDFWLRSTAVNKSADVMVFPWAKEPLLLDLINQRIPYSVLLQDIGRVIEEDLNADVQVPTEFNFFSKYRSIEEINDFLENLADKYSSICELLNIGHSYEGRPLLTLKVSDKSEKDKPTIWIQGGAHGREMIGPSAVLFQALKFSSLSSKDKNIRQLIEKFDWFFYPVVNPDGYEYARTTDRLWRKTRSINEDQPNCIGVDANRNWDFHWSGSLGSSTNPCSFNYAGKEAFSEPETRAIADFIQRKMKGKLFIFLDFHNYSQRWLTPWGYTSALPDNYADQKRLAEVATSALENVFGTQYSVGSSGNIMYTVTGGARDWAHGVVGAPYAYVIELRDNGQKGGFLLPRDQILPTAQETFMAVLAMIRSVANI